MKSDKGKYTDKKKPALGERTVCRLDKKDKKILRLLNDDASLSASKIARKVGLSRDTVRYRIKQMLNNKLLVCFRPVVDVRKLGLQWYFVRLKLHDMTLEDERSFSYTVKMHPYISTGVKCLDGGGYDFHLEVWAKSHEHLNQVIDELRCSFSKCLSDYSVMIGINVYKHEQIPSGFFEEL